MDDVKTAAKANKMGVMTLSAANMIEASIGVNATQNADGTGSLSDQDPPPSLRHMHQKQAPN